MHFVKVEGAGNDFVLLDACARPPAGWTGLARRICDRSLGVGADGVLVVGPGEGGADAHLTIVNADGGEARACGNGLRCVVAWLLGTGRARGPELTVDTVSGRRRGRRREDGLIEVELGTARFEPEAVPVAGEPEAGRPVALSLPPGLMGDPPLAWAVAVGNPHLVVRVAEPEAVDLCRYGPALQADPALPDGANVHFVALEGRRGLRARPFERGVGATRSCGTGAVAAAAVARRLGWIDADEVAVTMPGGRLGVRFEPRGLAWLSGPARTLFTGEWPES